MLLARSRWDYWPREDCDDTAFGLGSNDISLRRAVVVNVSLSNERLCCMNFCCRSLRDFKILSLAFLSFIGRIGKKHALFL